jgi:putative tributyrin esterase
MKKLFFFLLLTILVSSGIRAQIRHVITSAHISRADTVWVFTPSDYTADQSGNYPVIYLLNGWSGTYHQWNDITDCQAYADRYRFIIVCPDGLYDSWYINSPAVKTSQYADFFFLALMPFIAANYRADPVKQFISGLSMGGYGALYLFGLRPELFRSAGSLSGVLDLNDTWNEYDINKYLGIKGRRSGRRILEQYSVTGNIEKIARSGKPVIISCGTADRFYAINLDFRQACEEHHIDLTCITSPGGHDYAFWKSAIGYHFDFFARILRDSK